MSASLAVIPPGSYSGKFSATLSAALLASYTQMEVALAIAPADYINPAKSIHFSVSQDPGKNPVPLTNQSWRGGGQLNPDGTAPPVVFSIPAPQGHTVSVWFFLWSPITLSGTCTLS